MRENPDIGRPKQVQLIFDRPIIKTTPGLFRTWVITDGLTPSLHIDYKGTRIKQHHKEGWALRTDTTINNTYIFYIGKNLRNLPALRRIGFQVNLQLLQVQRISHDCILAEEAFQKINRLLQVASQCVSALRRSSSTSPLARPPCFSNSFPTAFPPPRDHRTYSPNSALLHYQSRPANPLVLHPNLQPHTPPRTRNATPRASPTQLLASALLR